MNKKLALAQLARHREPRLLVVGQSISSLGDGVALVALTLLVLDTTHNDVTKLAWFATARVVPVVAFLLIGGAIVDRYSRRVLLLVSDVARAVLTGGLVVLIGLGQLHFFELLIFGVLFGTFDALFMPAISAITPEIVPEDLLGAMNAVRPLSVNLMGNMIGPALGGLIAAASTSWAIALDAATFVMSATALALMHPTPRPPRRTSSMLEEIRGGVRYVRATRWLWTTLAATAFSNAFVFSAMPVLIPYFLRHNLHTNKLLVGYAFATSGLAGALGALFASNMKAPVRRIRTMWMYWSAGLVASLALGVATHYWQVLAVMAVTSPLMLLGNVVWESMMQTEVPRDLLGRASSVDWFVSLGLTPVGLVVAGQLARVVGVRTYYVVVSIIGLVPALWILVSTRINEIDVGRARGR